MGQTTALAITSYVSPYFCSTTKGRPVVLEKLSVRGQVAQSHVEDEVKPE